MSNKIIKELSNTRINEINKKMGTTDISKIADGTCTGAIKELSNQLIENGEGDNMGIADKVNAIYCATYGELTKRMDNVEKRVDKLENDVTTIKVYVGTDGNLHFIDGTGADSVIPF